MPRVVFTSHLGGIAPQGEPHFPGATVGEVLREAAARWPERTALVEADGSQTGRRWSYAELDDWASTRSDMLSMSLSV